jgi:hypothetical protein
MVHATYPHRHNRDGSFDSICTTCFATIGHTQFESDLTDAEQYHSCEQSILAGRGNPRPKMAWTGTHLVCRRLPTDAGH